jgi:hypothetical protein
LSEAEKGVLGIKRTAHEREATKWKKFRGRYEAVSYSWEGETPTEDLLCGLGATKFRLPVTRTVDKMLRHLRSTEKERFLWIDALCINQYDKEEKAEQISCMPTIFGEAKRVILWVGDASDQGGDVLKFLKTLKERDSIATIHKKLMAVFGRASVQPIQRFVARAWFKRRWIIQECVLAQEARLLCGSLSMDFTRFHAALTSLYGRWNFEAGIGRELVVRIGAIHRLRENRINQSPEQWPLLNLLVRFHQANCSNDHDRIFALLGLGAHNFGLTVDYNVSVEDHFHQFARQALIGGRSGELNRISSHIYSTTDGAPPGKFSSFGLDILNAAGAFPCASNALPSWVPDWRSPMRYRPLYDLAGGVDKGPLDFRGRSIPPKEHDGCLLLAGYTIARVTHVGDPLPLNHTLEQLISYIQGWWELYKKPISGNPSRWESDVVFSTTITANKMLLGLNKMDQVVRREKVEAAPKQVAVVTQIVKLEMNSSSDGKLKDSGKDSIKRSSVLKLFVSLQDRLGSKSENDMERRRVVPGNQKKSHVEREHCLDQETSKFYEFVSLVMAGRCCFTTDTGEFGIGPGNIKAGDVVAVLDGGQTPFVLRPIGVRPKMESRVRSVDGIQSLLGTRMAHRSFDSLHSMPMPSIGRVQSMDGWKAMLKVPRATKSVVGEDFRLMGDCYVDGVSHGRDIGDPQGSFGCIKLH